MKTLHTLRRTAVAALLLVAFLIQGTWALAGTTGSIRGTVAEGSGAPVAGAKITASSYSQTVSTTTDSKGNFTFISLAPDSYTVSFEKDGYGPTSVAGVTVFADNSQTLALTVEKSLTTIVHQTASTSGLVKSGTTADVYSVNSAMAKTVATIGGGGNLDSAYSAIYSQPGVNSQLGNYGFGQVFYIHGSSYSQIGYEFDGVPVNRAFDNYNASSLSNLGSSETQVYTGASPNSATSSSIGGYINQVIRTGTYPGFGDITASVGAPGFYHKLEVEAGGSNPARTFSYYIGLRGGNQDLNLLNNQNGMNLAPDGSGQDGQDGYGNNATANLNLNFITGEGKGPWSTCNADGSAPAGSSQLGPNIGQYLNPGNAYIPVASCEYYTPIYAVVGAAGTNLNDRENVVNLHFALPHKNDGGRDDVQILFDNFYYRTHSNDNINANGGLAGLDAAVLGAGGPNGYATAMLQAFGVPAPMAPVSNAAGGNADFCEYQYTLTALAGYPACAPAGPGPIGYVDGKALTGVSFGQAASTVTAANVTPYFMPYSSTQRIANYGIDPNAVGSIANNGSIIKVQYQKNFGSNAYLRAYGYTFYSDWLQSSPNAPTTGFGMGGVGFAGVANPSYELNTHTRGGQLQFADQINSANLFTATLDYVTASVLRMNNTQVGKTPNNLATTTLMDASGKCYSGRSNNSGIVTGNQTAYDNSYGFALPIGSQVSCLSSLANTSLGKTITGLGAPVGAAATAGAAWAMTSNLQLQQNINTVAPKFTTIAIQDEFRPNDKLDLNIGGRFERYTYVLGQGGYGAEGAFWQNAINSTACVDPTGNLQVPSSDFGNPAASGNAGLLTYYTTLPGQPCAVDPKSGHALVHPGNGGTPLISIIGGTGSISHSTLSPRIGGTYTFDPNTVLRFSYGRYTLPVNTAAEQTLTYKDGYAAATAVYGSGFYKTGLGSQIHDNAIQFSNNFDLSLEKKLKGTDISFKLSPFYRYTSQAAISVILPGNLAGSFNGATVKAKGVEFQIDKGDPSRNGFSGQLSYTYTSSLEKYSLIGGANEITTTYKSLFAPFFALANGAQCYQGGVADPTCGELDPTHPHPDEIIKNPYFGMLAGDSAAAEAAKYPVDGWYPQNANYINDATTALSPNIFSGFVSYKHDKLAMSLNAILQQGQRYGSPADYAGIDPTTCGENQGTVGLGLPASSQLADYQTCGGTVIAPNPQTGAFDYQSSFTEPWQFNVGGAVSYDLTPKVNITLDVANLFNRCFGGTSTAWSQAYKPNSIVCGYAVNGAYLGNTPGGGYFYGASPADPANGTTGIPGVMKQSYVPFDGGAASPIQLYIQANIKL